MFSVSVLFFSAKRPVDSQRGGEEISLVVFAGPHIASGNLEALIDPSLMGSYIEQDGRERESILDVARLAMSCANMQSKLRPNMNEVCKELRDLRRILTGEVMKDDLESASNGWDENSEFDNEMFVFHSRELHSSSS
jgi:hypothetical protein